MAQRWISAKLDPDLHTWVLRYIALLQPVLGYTPTVSEALRMAIGLGPLARIAVNSPEARALQDIESVRLCRQLRQIHDGPHQEGRANARSDSAEGAREGPS